jgi:hypothetical protein
MHGVFVGSLLGHINPVSRQYKVNTCGYGLQEDNPPVPVFPGWVALPVVCWWDLTGGTSSIDIQYCYPSPAMTVPRKEVGESWVDCGVASNCQPFTTETCSLTCTVRYFLLKMVLCATVPGGETQLLRRLSSP